ncbi:hypothetical protein SK128_016094 [Halocaridina rubra]|uniref:Sodium-coupled monocarboxylate transporter 1 n=1 Tax=Halocaridina rubra TaxID=373956 RepID=A0AAN9A742_HALRR
MNVTFLHSQTTPFTSSSSVLGEKLTKISKFLALLYGCICMAIAFMTQFLGSGILEASLKIFGAVGGPLLSVFTMGMLFKGTNQKGVMSGLAIGLAISMWIAFGKPKPPPAFKPVSVEGCTSNISDTVVSESLTTTLSALSVLDIENSTEVNNSLGIYMADTNYLNVTTGPPSLDRIVDESVPFIYNFYAISYMWVAGIGFVITLIFGLIISKATGGNNIMDEDLYSSWVMPSESANDGSVFLEKADPGNDTELHNVCSAANLTAAPRSVKKL